MNLGGQWSLPPHMLGAELRCAAGCRGGVGKRHLIRNRSCTEGPVPLKPAAVMSSLQ